MMHYAIATVACPTAAEAAATLPVAGADLVEIRLDAFWNEPPNEARAEQDLQTILDAAAAAEVKLLATLRPRRQGGAWDGPEDVRLNLLAACAQAGFAWVDLEADLVEAGPVVRLLREAGAKVVLSDHTLVEAPGREPGMLRLLSMQDQGAHLDKLVFQAGPFTDLLRALELAHGHTARMGKPCVIPLGYGGAESRALLRLAGNHATYGHAGVAAVPGQPALADIQAVWAHWGLPESAWPEPGHAPWFAVLGRPVQHSLSPRIHNAALAAAGRPERYGALDVPDSPGAFRLVCTIAGRIGLAGASITHPHKFHAAQVAEKDPVAQAVGAVNCIRFEGPAAMPVGTNTDATAFRRLLDGAASVAILGAGGAAAAAAWAARELSLPCQVIARNTEAAAELVGRFGATHVPWDQRDAVRADAWIQATTLGADAEPSPVSAETLAGASTCIELVYAAGKTAFEAAAVGTNVVSGRAFLVEQAVDAYRFWTGTDPDRAAMERALELA